MSSDPIVNAQVEEKRPRRKSGYPPRPVLTRFMEKVDPNGPLPTWAPFLGRCWMWTAFCDKEGYGGFDSPWAISAHRCSY